MELELIRDVFDLHPDVIVDESFHAKPLDQVMEELKKIDPVVDQIREARKNNKHVLGIIEGPSFVPGGHSRNGRYYPYELWERVVREEGPLISANGRLGTLEHPKTDEDAHTRNASHVLKKIWIDSNNMGMSKSYIIDTPMGAILASLALATDEDGNRIFPLYVSTRAYGKYLEGTKKNGNPVVDPMNFKFSTIDVVADPGFLEAKPDFIETVETCSTAACQALKEPSPFFISMKTDETDEVSERSLSKASSVLVEINSNFSSALNEDHEDSVDEMAKLVSEYEKRIEKLNKILEKKNEELSELKEVANKLTKENKKLKIRILTEEFHVDEGVVSRLMLRMDEDDVRKLLEEFTALRRSPAPTMVVGGNEIASVITEDRESDKKTGDRNKIIERLVDRL